MLARKVTFLALVISSLPLYGKNSFVKRQGCDTTSQEHLYILNINNHKLVKPLVLYLPALWMWEPMKNTWFDVEGSECSKSGHCRGTTHASVQILRVFRGYSIRWREKIVKGVSGNFSIELEDGRKLNGSFDANVRKPPKGISCE